MASRVSSCRTQERLFAPCMIVACLHHGEYPLPPAVSKGGQDFQALLRGREREETPCIAILDHHYKKKVAESARTSATSRYSDREATLSEGAGIYNVAILASIVELRGSYIGAFVGASMGDELLLASLRLGAGGPGSTELNTVAVVGKHLGVGGKTRALIDQEARINDAATKLRHFQVHTAHVLTDLALKFRLKNTKAMYPRPELTTVEKLKAAGATPMQAWR